MDLVALALAKKYVDDTANALGAVKGANATIESITPVEGGNNVVFAWTGTDGTKQTQTLFVANGAKGDPGYGSAKIEVLDSDPVGEELIEGRIWVLKTKYGDMTTPVIELGTVGEDSIAIKLSNASFDGSGAVVTTYNIYVNGVLNKTENIAPGGTCVVTGLSAETEYQISVCGVKGGKLSKASNTLTAITTGGEATEQEIVVVPGYCITAYNGNDLGAHISPNVNRAVAATMEGKQKIPPVVNGVQYFLIEVPDYAASCTVVCPNMMWGYNGWNTGNSGNLTYDIDSGWQNSGVTYTFAVGAAEYASIGFKRSDGGTVTAEDVAGITITFA